MSLNPSENPLAEILEEEMPPEKAPRPRGNRSFLLVIVILIILTAAALVFLFVVAPGMVAQRQAADAEARAIRYAENTATVAAATQQAQAMLLALTPSITASPTRTVASSISPSNTPLFAQPSATATESLSTAQAQTLAAMQTEVAGTQTAVALATQTGELPATGGWSTLGLVLLLVGVAAVLIALIFILRSLRVRMKTR